MIHCGFTQQVWHAEISNDQEPYHCDLSLHVTTTATSIFAKWTAKFANSTTCGHATATDAIDALKAMRAFEQNEKKD